MDSMVEYHLFLLTTKKILRNRSSTKISSLWRERRNRMKKDSKRKKNYIEMKAG
jgi:hypothetical protein